MFNPKIKFIGEPPENVDEYLKQLDSLASDVLDAEDMFTLDELEGTCGRM